MRKLFVVFCSLLSWGIHAQLVDDFSDGDFTNNPTWSGTGTKFIIDNGQMRSNSSTANDIFYLSTESTLSTNVEWRFRVNMQFATSSANYTDFMLMGNNANPSLATTGYILRVGNTKDEVSLYRIETGGNVLIIDGTDGTTENKNIALKITRNTSGIWALYADYTGGTNYVLQGNILDNTYTSCTHFAVLIKQSSSSFFQKHFFDDFYIGPPIVDLQKPNVLSTTATSNQQISIVCDEPISTLGTSFILDKGYGTPSNIDVNASTITLDYATPFLNGDYQLTLSKLSDLSANLLDTIVKFTYFKANEPKPGDILITEIFADPSPSFGLPDQEYIEIYNNTNESLNLENCSFSDGGTPALFPSVILVPSQYLIVVKVGNEPLFSGYGAAVGLTGFPALNNTGDNLKIQNANGDVLDSVNYTDDYYKDGTKKLGGYALERIYFSSACAEIDNWIASNAANGGTPGAQNSVSGTNPDQAAPRVLSATISSAKEIKLTLTENIKEGLADDVMNYKIIETNENPSTITINTTQNSLILSFETDFETNNYYTLLINELTDCKGNSKLNESISIISTSEPNSNDILINELLFNPKNDGVDFIEIYNNSDKYIDLSTLLLARYDKDERKDEKYITSFSYTLFPYQYVALTTDTNTLKSEYKTGKIWQVVSLPTMNNDAGTVLLLGTNGNVLDSVLYTEDQHFELIKDVNGVSLERTSFSGYSYYPNNWKSASTSAGYATPGYQNSQFLDLSKSNNSLSLIHKNFSPDGDGYEDLLVIQYQNDQSGYSVNGYVFDLAGTHIHQAVNMELMGTSGIISWDGILQNGTKIPVGNYVLLLESYDLNGKVQKKKFAFSVVGRF